MAYFVQTCILFLYCHWFSKFGSARDIITTTQFLRDPTALTSSRNIFKLGFFSPINTTNRYIGIWYNKGNELEVVWVANRDYPLNDSSGVLKISGDGNLQLMDGRNKSIWSSNVAAHSEVNNFVAQLLDTGNFVLLSNASGNIIWQSFAHPTDTLLPRMEATFDENTTLSSLVRSWKSASDPSYGRFTVGLRYHSVFEIVIWDNHHPYWRSGPWDGSAFLGVRNMYYSAQDNGFHLGDDNDNTFGLSFSTASRRVTVHYVVTYDGMGLQKDWDDNTGEWRIAWHSIEDQCDYYGMCGEFGSCNSNNSPICSCLRGFEPRISQEWSSGNWSSGCVRRSPLYCGTTEGKEDGFLKLQNTKVPYDAQWLDTDDEEDCRRHCLRNCSCLAYAYYLGFGCMIWNGSLVDIKVFSLVGVDLHVRLTHSEFDDTSEWKVFVAVIVIFSIVAVAILYCLWRWIGQLYAGKTKTKKEAALRPTQNMIGASGGDVEFQDLPLFNFEDLLIATNNFCESNKLGQGGFGPVYKGEFGDGQEIAVKRLSRASLQGPQEFMNEVVVISKLQHRNLVRLLGCCVEGEERLLVYEYMRNKSLDALLFDPPNQEQLDWKKRFNIIKGISRGLLYLHRDSRLRIIHRDLKASNILLDANLNPKISDFGVARIFGGNQDQGDTRTIVGTFGYMSPEYAMEGRFSGKSDVFSFGVLLLEILSGRSNTSFKDEDSLSLLGEAWKFWNDENILSFIDPKISKSKYEAEIMMCMQLGLLCVQEYPEDRPTISMVVAMIESEVTDLPRPTQPAFTQRRVVSWNEAIPYDYEHHSFSGGSITSHLSGR